MKDNIPVDVQPHEITLHPMLDQVAKGAPIRLEVINKGCKILFSIKKGKQDMVLVAHKVSDSSRARLVTQAKLIS